MKISILGSCLSRVALLNGDQKGHNIANGEKYGLELEYFLDKHNIALAMLPPPFPEKEVNTITAEELFDKTRDKSLKQLLMKKTVPMLLEGEAEYLVMDFYDFHNIFFSYKDTAFATQAHEFLNTALFRKYQQELSTYSFFDMPTWLYYPLVDWFFETIMQKFDSDHIILNRFRANRFFLNTDGRILLIPDRFKHPYQCHDKYNPACHRLEDYVIQKYNPYVIDLSKYFMGDAHVWSNLNGSHFEMEFYRETYHQFLRIVRQETEERYFEDVNLFDPQRPGYEEDLLRSFDVEHGLKIFESLSGQDRELSLNILDKLYAYAPEDPRVLQYIDYIASTM